MLWAFDEEREDEVVAALRALRDAVDGSWRPGDVLIDLLSQPAARRDRMAERLVGAAALLTGRRSVGVAPVADGLGLSVRALYGILERLKRMPPLEAVAPDGSGRTQVSRGPADADPRIAALDVALAEALAEDPGLRLADAVRAAAVVAAAGGWRAPAAKTVSRRLDVVRFGAGGGVVGAYALLDWSPVRVALVEGGVLVPQVLAVVADATTGSALGWGLRGRAGLGEALSDAAEILREGVDALRERLPVAQRMDRFSAVLATDVPRSSIGYDDDRVVLSDGTVRTAGVRLRRALGPRIGTIVLEPRRTTTAVQAQEVSDFVVLSRRQVEAVLRRQFATREPAVGSVADSTAPARPDALDDVVRMMDAIGWAARR